MRAWMAANGYTTARLARALGVSERTLYRWKVGTVPPVVQLALETLERRAVAAA